MKLKKSRFAGLSLVFVALAPPLAAAQTVYSETGASSGPVTRAQVKTDLRRLEQAGYDPATRDPYYPDQIQAAEKRVSEQDGTGNRVVLAPPAPAAP